MGNTENGQASEVPINEFNSYYSRDVSTYSYEWFDVFGDYSMEQLSDMIKDPMENNEILRNISRRLYSSNGLVRNTADYMTSMPTLDYVITSYIKTVKSNAQKEVMSYVLAKIKHKEFIRDALLKGIVDGTCFYYFDTGDKAVGKKKSLTTFETDSITEINSLKKKASKINAAIVSLPTDYCKIVRLKNNYYVVAFNLEYFDREGNETSESKLKKYPKEIREGYKKWKSKLSKQWLILDSTKTIVHKISSNRNEPWGRPLALAAIVDILYSDYFTTTKRNILDEINNQIFYQTFPQGKEPGTSALTGKQQKEQHEAVKQGIMNKNHRGGKSFFSVAAGTKIDKVEVTASDMFDDDHESNLDTKIGTALGFAASLLNASGTTSFSAQQTNLELVTSQIFQWIEQIVNELNKAINYNVLGNDFEDIKVNYLPITHVDKGKFIGYAKDLYLQGKGSLLLWASACGIPADVFTSMVEHEIEQDYENRYPVHRTSYTQSADNDSGGRPTLEESGNQVSNENTVQSRTANSNDNIKPSTKK